MAPTLYPFPHPFDLEVQDFSVYDYIIDARSPREHAVDHLPGALNLPVVDNDQYAVVGTKHRTSPHHAYLIGVTASLRNIAQALELHQFPPQSRILVYCFRGGKRSKLWADTLRTVGYKVDVLRGGWKAYRRWVISALSIYPRTLDFRVLAGPTGCGKTRLLKALANQGGQVLDLEELARHRGSLIGALPGVSQPSQKLFDSMLLEALRNFTPDEPVWIEGESKKIGNIALPMSLMTSMSHAPVYHIHANMPERVRIWREDFPHFVQHPRSLVEGIQHLRPLLGGATLNEWAALANEGKSDALFEQLMTRHYDVAYARSSHSQFENWSSAVQVPLENVDDQSLQVIARDLLASQARRPVEGA